MENFFRNNPYMVRIIEYARTKRNLEEDIVLKSQVFKYASVDSYTVLEKIAYDRQKLKATNKSKN